MPVSPKEYKKMGDSAVPPTNEARNLCCAFLIGGAICAIGQLLTNLYKAAGLGTLQAGALCSISLIFLSALLTGLGVYDNIAKFGGGGHKKAAGCTIKGASFEEAEQMVVTELLKL